MQKTILYPKIGRLLCTSFLFIFSFYNASGQIILRDQPLPLKPETFFIAAVNDERADKSTIGQLLVKDAGAHMVLQATDLKDGAAVAIGKFLQRNLPQNKSLKPIVIGIRELVVEETANKVVVTKEITEKNAAKEVTAIKETTKKAAANKETAKEVVATKGTTKKSAAANKETVNKEAGKKEIAQTVSSVDGRIRLSLSFALQKDYGQEHLVNYKGSMQYTRYGAGNAAIEEYLRSILKGSLDYLNSWMKNNSALNRKLAKNVKLSFTDFTEKTEGDTIYYSPRRPLTWADFQSRSKPAGRFEAQVIPGIAYTQEAQMDKGTIEVKIAMKAYLPKSASRVNYNAKDDYTLNHEQRHFDIAKIIAEQFKQKMLAKPLTPDTFEAAINMQYLDSYRDLDAMQRAYDKETIHGTDRSAQAAWNNKIDKALMQQ